MEHTETLEEILKRTLATLGSAKEQQTTPLPSKGSNKEAWARKWLKLKTGHPQLQRLEAAAFEFCCGYATRPARGSRLLIYGANGTGKSHTAKAIWHWANRIAMHIPLVTDEGCGARLATCELFNWPEVVNCLKAGDWELVERMMPVNLLILDDLGAEHDPSKMGIEKLYLLLERREIKWTVITTNVPPAEWENRFEKRIASRFLRNFTIVALDEAPDFKA